MKKRTILTVALTLLVALGLQTALAGSGPVKKNIDVLSGGISIYLDGVLQEPKNVKGETVEPIVWNGTTYLPVRALTNMLTDKEVTWDQENMSIWLGEKPEEPKVALEKLEMYSANSSSSRMVTGSNAEYTKVDKTLTPTSRLQIGNYATYILDGEYRRLTGKLDVSYDTIGQKRAAGLAFYAVDAYGEETLIKEYFVKAGDDAVTVNVPLTGVYALKIYGDRGRSFYQNWPYDSEWSSYYAQLIDGVLERL